MKFRLVFRRGFAVLAVGLTLALVLAPAPVLAAGEEESGGSPARLAIQAADESLGAKAGIAVARAYDRGYDGLQVVESLYEHAVREDGTITEGGKPLAPFRTPSGVVAGNGGPTSPEAIALDALERGIQKTTQQLDKKHNLTARAKQLDIENEEALTTILIIAATLQGYTPDQILVDGLMGGGFRLSPAGMSIVDENGKRIPPGDVEVSEEQEEAESVVESFVLDAMDLVSGIDPRAAAETRYDQMFTADITITYTLDEGSSYTIDGKAEVGRPTDKKLRQYLVGDGTGQMKGSGACWYSGEGTKHPYTVDGNVDFGISGRSENGGLTLRLAITEANLSVQGDNSLCVDVLRDSTGIFEAISFPPFDIRPRAGATATTQTSFGGALIDLKFTLRT